MLERRDPLRAFATLVLAVVLAVMIGWLLVVGRAVLMPIFIAVISVYVLLTASEALGRVPVIGFLPEWVRRGLVLALFVLALIMLASVMVGTAEQVVARLPVYQKNLTTMLTDILSRFDIQEIPNLTTLIETLWGRINLQRLAAVGLGSVGSLAGIIFMAVVYSIFLMAERGGFARKIAAALPRERASQTHTIVRDINRSIGEYLAVKTLVNIMLGMLSFVVLTFFGVDFALFWAVLIGLLNYIPYVGSLLGVMFPVLLTLAQYGSLQTTLFVAVLLTSAQIWVGNALEPRMIGRRINMSPFVVLVSLALWSSLWGIPGAILAIPLTSIIAIIMANFESTRPIALMLADDVQALQKSAEE
ncbi:AI-2E family transporter [uncultured Nitratireductor sp.]|uniref:AI-2E family transporter n=1 Tax=uncultured Nitratireductor sp. TaxID=520953 RepID=UPI0025E471BC|nr:AI-2E family transporter [uncultured Nitratireductor sp.]